MNCSAFRRLLAMGLSVSFLFVSVALTQHIPFHLHGSHDKQTHEQTWCSWSCQAGQAVQALPPLIQAHSHILEQVGPPTAITPDIFFQNFLHSRAPPIFPLS